MTQGLKNAQYIATARTDGHDRLIEADEPLAGLHERCGGEPGGVLAVPQMLALVQKVRRYNLPLARAISANDGEERIRVWLEVSPLGSGGDEGCEIGIGGWQSAPILQGDESASASRRIEVNRASADLIGRLDSKQNLLTFQHNAADLRLLAKKMNEGTGQPWTDFVEFPGNNHHQPLHWRLLDGSICRIEGSEREWRTVLAPLGQPEPGSAGFELFLVSDQLLPAKPADDDAPTEIDNTPKLGRDLSPVLRKPIARIIANAETIRSRLAGPLADEYSDYAADIATAGQHLLSLIEDLTDLEVVESEKFATAPDKIDLIDVAKRAAGILGVRAQEKQIELILPPEGDDILAVGEFRRVLQVLLNLIGNAISYSPNGSRVEIRAALAGGKASIAVADMGPGLDEAQKEVIFQKFERLGRSGDGGSGLGLYISKRLADAMNGTLEVASEPGQGACFTLSLPSFAERREKPR